MLSAMLLSGCYAEPLPAPCSPSRVPPAGEEISVYFGCGCFWHMQHGFALLEMADLCRRDGNVTARTAYAGGSRTGPDGLVCYHNFQDVADYGMLGHAEAVALSVPKAAFGSFAAKFWELCAGGERRDTQDVGGEYRSVVGLPGGMQSPFMAELRKGAGSAKLVAGSGDDGDTLGRGEVQVYDTRSFPAHAAEKYHQFHDDMMDAYGGAYNALQRFASRTSCPGDGLRLLMG
mmetsp:Transcript_9764/g.26491  ORF Transcript_9764/g.26491 Transcript_9764/m.26491 type:complete len:232 (-) Transcript_9764:174-869(-)